MILNEEQANQRLSSPNNLANRLAAFRKEQKLARDENGTVLVTPGKRLPRLPAAAKEEIIEKALAGDKTQKEIAEEYGVSAPAVGHLKRKAEKEIASKQDAQRNAFLEQALKDLAQQKMLLAMGLITEEKLESLKAKDLANISASLSSVLGTVAPKGGSGQQINLVVYSPEVREESSYKVVEIRAQE